MTKEEVLERVEEVYGDSCMLTIARAALEHAADTGTGIGGVLSYIDDQIAALNDVWLIAWRLKEDE